MTTPTFALRTGTAVLQDVNLLDRSKNLSWAQASLGTGQQISESFHGWEEPQTHRTAQSHRNQGVTLEAEDLRTSCPRQALNQDDVRAHKGQTVTNEYEHLLKCICTPNTVPFH